MILNKVVQHIDIKSNPESAFIKLLQIQVRLQTSKHLLVKRSVCNENTNIIKQMNQRHKRKYRQSTHLLSQPIYLKLVSSNYRLLVKT